MKKLFLNQHFSEFAVWAAILLLFTAILPAEGSTNLIITDFQGSDVVAGEIVVVTNPRTVLPGAADAMDDLADRTGAEILRRPQMPNITKWSVQGEIEPLLEALNQLGGVSAFPNYVDNVNGRSEGMNTDALNGPDDPYFKYQWALHNEGAVPESLRAVWGTSYHDTSVPGSDIDMLRAWKEAEDMDLQEVLVVVFDTGVDIEHPDLQANIWTNPYEIPGNGIDDDGNGYIDDVHGYNVYDDNENVLDIYGHGTHVAGSIAAALDSVGIAGVATNVKIVPVRVGSPTGGLTTYDEAYGMTYISDLQRELIDRNSPVRIVAVNHSWGNYYYSSPLYLQKIELSRQFALEQYSMDIAWINSAGNDSKDLDEYMLYSYPSGIQVPNILAVSAADYLDEIDELYSNYGQGSVDVAAPGTDILSTFPGGNYQVWSGTSMAAPHVTGLYALLKGAFPNEDISDIFARIMSSADRGLNYDGQVGCDGRINAFYALSPDSLAGGILPSMETLHILTERVDGEARAGCGFINAGQTAVTVDQVTVTFSDGDGEVISADIGDKDPLVEPGEAYGVNIALPVDLLLANDGSLTRTGTVEFGSVLTIPFVAEVQGQAIPFDNFEANKTAEVSWGELTNTERTIGNIGDAPYNFQVISYITHHYGKDVLNDISAVSDLLKLTDDPDPETSEEVLNKALDTRPVIRLMQSKSGTEVVWEDSLNLTNSADAWSTLTLGAGDAWQWEDADSGEAVEGILSIGSEDGLQPHTFSYLYSPVFDIHDIVETYGKMPSKLEFDLVSNLAGGDLLYLSIVDEERLARVNFLIGSTGGDSVHLVLNLTALGFYMLPPEMISFKYVVRSDAGSEGSGVILDNFSMSMDDMPLYFTDGKGNIVSDGMILPGESMTLVEHYDTRVLPEGLVLMHSDLLASQFYLPNLTLNSAYMVNYGNGELQTDMTESPSFFRGDGQFRAEAILTNTGITDIDYTSYMWIDYSPNGPLQSKSSGEMTDIAGGEQIEEPRITADYPERPSFQEILALREKADFRPQVLSTENRIPVQKSLLIPQTASEVILPGSWYEDFESEVLSFPEGWECIDYTHGFGDAWRVDSISGGQAAVFGDPETNSFRFGSFTDLYSPWWLVDNMDSTEIILEFDYLTTLLPGEVWLDLYLTTREPGDEDSENWSYELLASNLTAGDQTPALQSDGELHTLAITLPSELQGKEISIDFFIDHMWTDNLYGFAAVDNIKLYQIPQDYYILNRKGSLAPGENQEITFVLNNTDILPPGHFSVALPTEISYSFDSDYTDLHGASSCTDILQLPGNWTFTVLNNAPTASKTGTIYSHMASWVPMYYIQSYVLSLFEDADPMDFLTIVDFSDPLYGKIFRQTGSDHPSEQDAYIAPVLPVDVDNALDGMMFYVSDGWDTVNTVLNIEVFRSLGFIDKAQHVFPMNEDDSLRISLITLAAGVTQTAVDLSWNENPDIAVSYDDESKMIRLKPAQDFYGTVELELGLNDADDEWSVTDRDVFTFVVSSVNDLPEPQLKISRDKNTFLFEDLSTDARDPEGAVVSRIWSFGDGSSSTEKTAEHIYDAIGDYRVTLLVTDNAGAQSVMDTVITVDEVVSTASADGLPETYSLGQNYPNPFNPATTVDYGLPEASHVSIKLYNMQGQTVRTLLDQYQDAGYYTLTFRASDLPSGVYLYRIQAGDYSQVRKCLLLK